MNIKEIVARVNNGTIKFDYELEPFFIEFPYIDSATEVYIGRQIVGTEIGVYFPEVEIVRMMRQAVYDGEMTENELTDFLADLNGLDYRYDFNTVAFIKDEKGIKWA